MKSLKSALLIIILSCLGCPAVLACRFNVRDVGFVDLENQPYGLFCYINNSTEKHVADDFKEVANAELPQTNIKVQMINVDQASDHPAMQFFKLPAKSFPVLVLISPDGKAMPIESIEKGQGFKDSLQKVIGEVVSSPMRKEIIEKTIDAFGVVLIIEGPDAEENNKAVTSAQAAIKMIASQMDSLPKAISKPPVILKMSRQQHEQEKILLWSMGVDADNITEAHAVILYGRGRLMGSVLRGEVLTEKMLLKFLYVIGSDCECGLARSWMQGNMMPAKWDNERLEMLSEQLGFDTEHPMIKIEMSQILRKEGRSGEKKTDHDAINNFGYQEIEIEFDDPAVTAELSQEPVRILNNDPQPQTAAEQTEVDEDEFKLSDPLYMIGIVGIPILLIGVYFIVSASGRKR